MKNLILVVVLQAIWSSSYVAMKVALLAMPVGLVMILRYGIAALILLFLVRFKLPVGCSRRDWILIIVIGIAIFTLSPYLQLKSLTLTQATDVSILVSVEPLITALAASFFLKEKITWDLAVVFLIATGGLLFMSGFPTSTLLPTDGGRLLGNLLFLGALGCEAAYSVAGRSLTQRYSPLHLTTWMFVFGALANLAFNAKTLQQAPAWSDAPASWAAAIYLAAFCSAFGYTTWYFLVQRIPVSYLALSLFLQPVIGSLLGVSLMGERLDLHTLLGGGIIVLTLFIWVAKGLHKRI